MAKTINKNWALIESMGYTIQRALGGDFPAQKFEAVPLQESIEQQIYFASGDDGDQGPLNNYNGPGADLSGPTLAALNSVSVSGHYQLEKELVTFSASCIFCHDFVRRSHGFYCHACAARACTPEIARACNAESAWAAARKGGDMDKAMAEIIAATPALRAEVGRRALAALIPATPTATRRQAKRL